MNKLYSITLTAILGLVAFDAAGVIPIPLPPKGSGSIMEIKKETITTIGTQMRNKFEAMKPNVMADLADGLADIEQDYSSYLIKTCSPMAGGNRLVTYINPSYDPKKKHEGSKFCFIYERRNLPTVKIVDGKPDYHIAIDNFFKGLVKDNKDQGLMSGIRMTAGMELIAKYNKPGLPGSAKEIIIYFEKPMIN